MNHSTFSDQNRLDLDLDRLVDGELSESERLALLEEIAKAPNGEGWKRCALAFLEAQCWRAALGPIARPDSVPDQDQDQGRSEGPLPRQRRWAGVRPSILLAAATVLIAFAGGWLLGGQRAASPSLEHQVAQIWIPQSEPAEIEPDQQQSPVFLADESSDSFSDSSASPWQTVGYVQLPAENGREQDFRVPVLAGPGLDDDWLRRQPPAVPDSIRKQWENQGYRVEQRRRLVSVEMEDGRYLSIPVDEVDVHFAGSNTF